MADFDQIDRRLDDWIDANSPEIVESARELIRIPSVLGDPAPDAPFGIESRRALDFVLALAGRHGFRTKMVGGYAAHAEFGEGAELIGVLGHVDVVPAGSDWKHEPFGAEVEDGKIYGRGAIDDKGPTIAGLYGLIAVKEVGVPVMRRLRLIAGADEETGFRCMKHYFGVAREEMPTLGFTPDGRFPVIYAEKGIAKPTLSRSMPAQSGPVRILEMSAGQRSNMVPDRAQATLLVDPSKLGAVEARLIGITNITYELDGIDRLLVRAVGVSAHASRPENGTNAVMLLTEALIGVDQLAEVRPLLTTLHDWAADNSGACLGIAGSEEITGPLTSNLGVLEFDGRTVSATFSIRHPVTWKEGDLKTRIEQAATSAGFELASWDGYDLPLHVPADSPLVQTLLEVYRAETGDMSPPQTMGGGTYARVLKQGVAFGPNFPGFPDNAHQADEYWTVEDLIKATRIYAKALARLGNPL